MQPTLRLIIALGVVLTTLGAFPAKTLGGSPGVHVLYDDITNTYNPMYSDDGASEDHDRGHGNDSDGHDEDNPAHGPNGNEGD